MLAKIIEPLEKIAPHDFKRKFSAWWDGNTYVPLPEGKSEAEPGGKEEVPGKAIPEKLLSIAVAQALWGEGYLAPGTGEFYAEMVKTLSLNNEKSVGLIGAGLGGPARDIIRAHDIWIAGYEKSQEAIDEANRLSTMAGLARKLTIENYCPETIEFPEQKFDAILSFEELCFVEDKERLLKQMEIALKYRGYLLITDYVQLTDDISDDELAQMFLPGCGAARLWTAEQYTGTIGEVDLGLRVQEDITKNYLPIIEKGHAKWKKLLEELQEKAGSAAAAAAICKAIADEEGQCAAKLEALQSGKIAIYRFLALKSAAPV